MNPPKNNSFRLDERTREKIRVAVTEAPVTQSEIMCRAACPRKWFYRYVLQLQKRGVYNWHFLYGDLLHKMLAALYLNRQQGTTGKQYPIRTPEIEFPDGAMLTPEDREQARMLRSIARITFKNYRDYYQTMDSGMAVKAVEKAFSCVYKGVLLVGKIDLVARPSMRDGIFIWDYKTTGMFNQYILDAWSFRFQFLFYSWLYWKVTGEKPDGNYVNGILKTLLRLKKGETEEAYLDRINFDMIGNREKYFYRVRMPLGTGALERFQEEILDPHIDAICLMQQQGVDINTNVLAAVTMAMNTDECHKYSSFCEFLPLCKDGRMMLPEYDIREQKHAELELDLDL